MKRPLFFALVAWAALVGALPAYAEILSWRASGTVIQISGETSVLPFTAALGDSFVLDFTFSTEASDSMSFLSNVGIYSFHSLRAQIGATSIAFDTQTPWASITVANDGSHTAGTLFETRFG